MIDDGWRADSIGVTASMYLRHQCNISLTILIHSHRLNAQHISDVTEVCMGINVKTGACLQMHCKDTQ